MPGRGLLCRTFLRDADNGIPGEGKEAFAVDHKALCLDKDLDSEDAKAVGKQDVHHRGCPHREGVVKLVCLKDCHVPGSPVHRVVCYSFVGQNQKKESSKLHLINGSMAGKLFYILAQSCYVSKATPVFIRLASAYYFTKWTEVKVMKENSGKISVSSENIFPIIRQWLYSEEEIFLRELVANALDALAKREMLARSGKISAECDEFYVRVYLDSENKCLHIEDNGIGMTAEEVDKYINQIACSGLVDFVQKYQEIEKSGQSVIGHFGLGFYSAFMVSDKVEINTLSTFPDQEAVRWESEDGENFRMSASDKKEIGTDILLHLSDEGLKNYPAFKIRSLLAKYCGFMAYPVFFSDKSEEKGEQINDHHPLWLKKPLDCTDKDYLDFYQKNFPLEGEPLFHIHLNMDYPLRLQGILYFPSDSNHFVSAEGRIRVYSRQVFVSDHLHEMIPDFLFLLQGFLDCPDLPLNVSRSYLQNDATVKRLSAHIVKKVADELVQLFHDDRGRYEEIWPKLERFIKIGSLQDEKFARKLLDIFLFEDKEGQLRTLAELPGKTLTYSDRQGALGSYAELLPAETPVLIMDHEADLQFMALVEYLKEGEIHFRRLDAALDQSGDEQDEMAASLFAELMQRPSLTLSLRSLGADKLPLLLTQDEETRRLKEVKELLGQTEHSPTHLDLDQLIAERGEDMRVILNKDNPLVTVLQKTLQEGKKEESEKLAAYLLDLAKLARGELKGDELKQFLSKCQNFAEEALKG